MCANCSGDLTCFNTCFSGNVFMKAPGFEGKPICNGCNLTICGSAWKEAKKFKTEWMNCNICHTSLTSTNVDKNGYPGNWLQVPKYEWRPVCNSCRSLIQKQSTSVIWVPCKHCDGMGYVEHASEK